MTCQYKNLNISAPFYLHGLTLIPARIKYGMKLLIHYLSIPKLHLLHRWSLGMDKLFHPTLYSACDYLSMLRLKLIHVNESGPRSKNIDLALPQYSDHSLSRDDTVTILPFILAK